MLLSKLADTAVWRDFKVVHVNDTCTILNYVSLVRLSLLNNRSSGPLDHSRVGKRVINLNNTRFTVSLDDGLVYTS